MDNKKIAALLPFLQCPDDASALRYDASMQQLINDSDTATFRYDIQYGIPILLSKKNQQVHSDSAVHLDANSQFDYRNHYEKDADYYDYFAQAEDGPTRHENRRLHESILARIPTQAKRLLDVGCGGGWLAKALQHKNVELVSMDINVKNVSTVLEKYPFEGHHGVVGDLFALPFRQMQFDCIVCSEVIEHVVNPGLLLQQLVSRLAPNGVLILTTPHDEKIIYHLCVHCNRPTPANAHLHSFTKETMMRLATEQCEGIHAAQVLTFSNRYLTRLRSYVLLQWLPHAWWWTIDQLANRLLGKPVRLLLHIERKQQN